jgi:hypothetical protein
MISLSSMEGSIYLTIRRKIWDSCWSSSWFSVYWEAAAITVIAAGANGAELKNQAAIDVR